MILVIEFELGLITINSYGLPYAMCCANQKKGIIASSQPTTYFNLQGHQHHFIKKLETWSVL